MENDLGVINSTVDLRKHNPDWKDSFAKERELLLAIKPKVIEEVSLGGSTAIPNISAKPILDIFARVTSLSETEVVRRELEKLGYKYRDNHGVKTRISYIKESGGRRTVHLQLAEETSPTWIEHLLIKNYLLAHPDVAIEYEKIKLEMAKNHPNDRGAYGAGKHNFIQLILQKAKSKTNSS